MSVLRKKAIYLMGTTQHSVKVCTMAKNSSYTIGYDWVLVTSSARTYKTYGSVSSVKPHESLGTRENSKRN